MIASFKLSDQISPQSAYANVGMIGPNHAGK